MFKRFIGLVSVLALASALTVPAAAQKAAAKETTLTGELVDASCYLAQGAKAGGDHAKCAEACVRGGGPIALVTSSGDTYIVLGGEASKLTRDELAKHLGHTVKATGTVSMRGGVRGITIASLSMVSM